MPEITVGDLLNDRGYRLDVELLAGGAGLPNGIRVPRIQKPGLALAGYTEQVRPHRVQILGATEISYLDTLSAERRDGSVRRVFGIGVACFVVTKGLPVAPVFLEEAERTRTPLLRTALRSSVFIERISRYL
ncbi:MAG: HPr kinase/phosphorylase, partial [Proteobacteria bacterium]|nr:HPr kinase/phosphorylase [Pseudomonadota bacterium]